MEKRFVVYRATISGALGAWAIRMAFPDEDAQLFFMSHLRHAEILSPPPPQPVRSLRPRSSSVGSRRMIAFVECCGPNTEWVRACCGRFTHVFLWDHHKNAHEVTESFKHIDPTTHETVDTSPRNFHPRTEGYLSGCMAAVANLGVKLTESQRILFARVHDHEMGIHLYPHSHAFAEAVRRRGIEYDVHKNPALFAQLAALDPDVLEQEAITIERETSAAIGRWQWLIKNELADSAQ
jgi:hypothetical protein